MTKDVAEKTIKIKLQTHKRLTKRGTAGDTMDDVITQLLDATEK
jgi:hypothetical protein